MKPPRTVVFDLGKVLLNFDYAIAVNKLAARCATNASELKQLDQSPLLVRYETGQLTTEQFFAEAQAAIGFRGHLAEFAGIFGDIFTPIPPMIQLNEELRVRGVPTYIFSNTNELAIRHIRQTYAFFKNFNGYIFSYEHGAMKPDGQLYEVVEKMTACRGGELAYWDDRSENVAAGLKRGWRAFLHQSPAQSRLAMQQLGLLA